MFLLFKAHWKVPDGPNSVLRWQGNELLDQVLLLCHTHKMTTSHRLPCRTQIRCPISHIHRNNPTPVTGSYRSPPRSWWQPLWKLDGQDQRWETCSSFSLPFPSISLSCYLDGQTTREECVFGSLAVIVTDFPVSLISKGKLMEQMGYKEAGAQPSRLPFLSVTPAAAHTFKHLLSHHTSLEIYFLLFFPD